jgi:hypothetical protein
VTEQRRILVPVEIATVLAVAVVSIADVWPERLPIVLPLFAAASLLRWWRGRSWGEVAGPAPGYPKISAVVGVAALAIAVVAGTPLVEAVLDRAIVWSTYPIVRGSVHNLVVVALIVTLVAVCAELVFHGWIVDRVIELGGPRAVAVLAGALAEALVTPGDLASRIGSGVFGLGLGWMYLAGGRSVRATVPARIVFQVGAVVLESLRVID